MRRAIPCPTCATPIEALWVLFHHEPECRRVGDLRARESAAQQQADDLRARERAARSRQWQLRKQHNRLQRQLDRTAKTITTGRGGLRAAKELYTLATRVTQGLPVF